MAGGELQFREFFAAEFGRLRGLGYLLTGDWAQAEELAQDALVRTYWAWSRVRRHQRPAAYARKVLVNRHRSLLRRAVLEARHARGGRPEEAHQPDLGEDGLVLWAAVRRLPARQRTVLVLRYHEDLPEAEGVRLRAGRPGAVAARSTGGGRARAGVRGRRAGRLGGHPDVEGVRPAAR